MCGEEERNSSENCLDFRAVNRPGKVLVLVEKKEKTTDPNGTRDGHPRPLSKVPILFVFRNFLQVRRTAVL